MINTNSFEEELKEDTVFFEKENNQQAEIIEALKSAVSQHEGKMTSDEVNDKDNKLKKDTIFFRKDNNQQAEIINAIKSAITHDDGTIPSDIVEDTSSALAQQVVTDTDTVSFEPASLSGGGRLDKTQTRFNFFQSESPFISGDDPFMAADVTHGFK